MKISFLSLLIIFTSTVVAQDQNSSLTKKKEIIFPSLTLQNPLNPGTLGTIVFSGVVQEKTRLANKPDGNAELYIGLGEPKKFIGAGLTTTIYGLTNDVGEQDNMGKGALSFHINRYLLSQKLLIDAGIDNAILWGGPKDSRDYITYQPSAFVSANYLFTVKSTMSQPFSYLSVTAGAGNGYFKDDQSAKHEDNHSFNSFVSIATPLAKATHFIAEWNGYDVGLGVSTIPVQKFPIMFRAEATDLAYGEPRFVFSLSLPFFLKKNNLPANRPIGLRSIRPERTL